MYFYELCIISVLRDKNSSKLYRREKRMGKGSLQQFCKSLFFHLNETSDVWGGKMPFSIMGTFTTNQGDEYWFPRLHTGSRILRSCHLLVSRRRTGKTRVTFQVRSQDTKCCLGSRSESKPSLLGGALAKSTWALGG